MGQHPADHDALPLELFEEIVLRLSPGEIPPLRLLSHRFCQFIDNSPAIKYRLNLFSAGLEERDTGESLTIRDRLRKLETYCSRWERFEHAERITLGPPPFSTFWEAYAGKGFLVYGEDAGNCKENIHFVRLPSPAMEILQEEWTIWGLPRCAFTRSRPVIHPPSDLLVRPVLYNERSSYRIEMFHMSNGEPYSIDARSPTVGDSCEPSMRVDRVHVELTGHRLAALVSVTPRTGNYTVPVNHLNVWDWRTGELFLEQVWAPNKFVRFVDDYRLIGTPPHVAAKALTLWDTSTKQNWGVLGLELETASQFYRFVSLTIRDSDTSHGLPFCGNPSKGIVTFAIGECSIEDDGTTTQTFAINPVGGLASLAPKMGTVESVPWQEWQHLVTPIPVDMDPQFGRALHSKVLDIGPASGPTDSTPELRIFDFSLRARRRKVQGDPSAPLPQYTVQKFPLDEERRNLRFYFMEGGVLVTPYRDGERYFWPI